MVVGEGRIFLTFHSWSQTRANAWLYQEMKRTVFSQRRMRLRPQRGDIAASWNVLLETLNGDEGEQCWLLGWVGFSGEVIFQKLFVLRVKVRSFLEFQMVKEVTIIFEQPGQYGFQSVDCIVNVIWIFFLVEVIGGFCTKDPSEDGIKDPAKVNL